MRRVIIILIIIVLFLLSTSCSLTNTCSKNDNYKIDYYSGGGFTGIESGVTINCNGEVRFWERKPNTNSTTIDSLRLNDKQIIEFNKMLENPELFVYKNIFRGNYTTHLILMSDEKSNNVSFNISDPTTNMPKAFSDLITAIKQIKKTK